MVKAYLISPLSYYQPLDNLDALPLLHVLVDYSKPLLYWEHGLLRKRRGINGKAIQFAARLVPQGLMSTYPTSDTGDLPRHLAISKKNGIAPGDYDRKNSTILGCSCNQQSRHSCSCSVLQLLGRAFGQRKSCFPAIQMLLAAGETKALVAVTLYETWSTNQMESFHAQDIHQNDTQT